MLLLATIPLLALLAHTSQIANVCADLQDIKDINLRLLISNGSSTFYSNVAYFCGPDAPKQLACKCVVTNTCNSFKDGWGRNIGQCQCCSTWMNSTIFIPPVFFCLIVFLYAYVFFYRDKIWWLEGYPRAIVPVMPDQRCATICPEGAPLPSHTFDGFNSDDFDNVGNSAGNTCAGQQARALSPAPPEESEPRGNDSSATDNANHNMTSSSNSNDVRTRQEENSSQRPQCTTDDSDNSSVLELNPLAIHASVAPAGQTAMAKRAAEDIDVAVRSDAVNSALLGGSSHAEKTTSNTSISAVSAGDSDDCMNVYAHSYNVADLGDDGTNLSACDGNNARQQNNVDLVHVECLNRELQKTMCK